MSKTASLEDRLTHELVNNARGVAKSLLKVIRNEIAADLQQALGVGAPKKPAPQRITQCIAPGCKRDNRGPRFHYCCKKHDSAPAKVLAGWRKAFLAREKDSARQTDEARAVA